MGTDAGRVDLVSDQGPWIRTRWCPSPPPPPILGLQTRRGVPSAWEALTMYIGLRTLTRRKLCCLGSGSEPIGEGVLLCSLPYASSCGNLDQLGCCGHTPPAHAISTHHQHTPSAHATSTHHQHMPSAHATSTRHQHTSPAHATSTRHQHMLPAHATSTRHQLRFGGTVT